MKWVYAIAGLALFIKMLLLPNPAADWEEVAAVEAIVTESGVSNAVSGIIFRTRLLPLKRSLLVFIR